MPPSARMPVGALNEAVALFARAAEIETDERRRAEHLVRAALCSERYGNQETVAAGHYAAARDLHERAGRRREALATTRTRAVHLPVEQALVGADRPVARGLRCARGPARRRLR